MSELFSKKPTLSVSRSSARRCVCVLKIVSLNSGWLLLSYVEKARSNGVMLAKHPEKPLLL